MKIGIITIYDLLNYGNRLQNYATTRVLHELGGETETLILKEYTLRDVIKIVLGKNNVGLNWNWKQETDEYYNDLDEAEKEKYNNFYQFTYDNMTLRKMVYFNFLPFVIDSKYDYFITGSDQVWNPYIAQAKDWEFLLFSSPKKRISFSASFGLDSIPYDQRIVDALNDFKALSVREEAGAKIIKDLTGRDAVVLVDPTMLLSSEEWRNLAKKPRGGEEGYILTYFLSPKNNEAAKELDEIRDGREVYELLNPEDQVCRTAGPSEFLWLFDHADFILTDSFHACVFSFLFNKPFIVYERNWDGGNMNSRLETLLQKFHLERKYANSGLENDIWEHDYEEGYKQLEIEREKAKNFLKKALVD